METNISKLLQLEHNCRNSENIKELYFQIVNQTRSIVDYSQGVLLTNDFTGKYKVVAISDVSVVDTTSPFVQWIESIVEDLNKNEKSKDIFFVDNRNDLSKINFESINEYSPPNLLYVPLKNIKEDIETYKIYSNLKILKPKAKQLLAMKILAARPEPAKDFIDAYILCKELNITTKDRLLEICSEYIPLTLIGPRQVTFIKYLGEDLGYDWK